MKPKPMTVKEAQKHFGPCPRPCGVCHPGHHWYLDFRGKMGSEIWCVCKHCEAAFPTVDDDPNLPEI